MTKVHGIRLTDEEFARYTQLAALQGLSFNRWAGMALKRTAELQEALRRQEERRSGPVVIPLDEGERVRRGLPADLDEALRLDL
jgi:hypothetical protein